MTDSPRTNPYISDEERDYITSSVGEDKEDVTQKVNILYCFPAQQQRSTIIKTLFGLSFTYIGQM
jgi:hypothetical protein